VQDVYVDPLLQRWIVDLVRTTREHEGVAIGSSVRGSLALERTARAWALLDGRDYVVPEDIERLFVPVLVHRMTFRPSFLAEARTVGWDEAVAMFQRRCLARAPRPAPEALVRGSGPVEGAWRNREVPPAEREE
jgi:MoxR-like ATPase